MQKLIDSRRAYLGWYTRVVNRVEKALSKEMSEALDEELETHLASLEDKWNQYEASSRLVMNECDIAVAEQKKLLDDTIDHDSDLKDKYLKFKTKINRKRRMWQEDKDQIRAEKIARAAPAPQVTIENPAPPPRESHLRLKPTELKSFSGDILEWKGFWEVFQTTVDEKDGVEDVEKLAHLKSYLEGDALLTIASLAVTGPNYAPAKKLLSDRYDDDESIIDAHLTQLNNLQPVRNINDVQQLRRFQLKVEQHIGALGSLKVAKTSFGVILTPNLLRKIPDQLQRKWFEDPLNKITSIDLFLKFLKENTEALERFSRLKPVDDPAKQGNKNPQQQQQSVKPPPSTAAALTTLSEPPAARQTRARLPSSCPICDQTAHKPSSCPLTVDARRQMLARKNACFNCLRTGHL